MNTEAVKQIAIPLATKVLGDAAKEYVPELLDLARRAILDSRTKLDDVTLLPVIDALDGMLDD